MAEKSWPQINSAIYGPSPSNCSPREGKYCSLSRITGCRNAPKACFMASHKCSQGEAARVGLISAPEESRSVTHAPLGNAVMDAFGRWREALKDGGEGILLCITPVLDIPIVTQDGGPLLRAWAAGGCEAVAELSSRYTSALCHPTGRQMEGRPCHMLPFTKFPLDTLHARRISHFKR